MEKYKEVTLNNSSYLESVSHFQKDVERCLKKNNFDVISEFKINQPYIMKVDALIKPNIIIESQGPNHYLKPIMKESTKTIMKQTLLKMLGYKVISIPFFEWHQLHDDQKSIYLSKILSNV